MCSINPFLLSSRFELHQRQFPSHCSFNSLKVASKNSICSPKPYAFLLRQKQFSILYSKLTEPLNFRKPTSKNPLLVLHKSFLKVLAGKAVVLLLGSFILAGFRNPKPILALPSKSGSVGSELEVEEMFEKVLERDPENLALIKVVLYRKMKRGKTEEALQYIERLIRIEPKEVEWKLLRALCYEMAGQLTKAERLFKEILEERPLLLRALHGLAMVMHKNREGPALFKMLYKALELARRRNKVTEQRSIEILIGQMHVVKGQLEEGLKKFEDLIDENPRDFRPYLCQGIIYSLMDKKEEAAKQFETYWSLVPEEYPQRRFLDDVVLAAQTESRERLQKQFEAKSPYQ